MDKGVNKAAWKRPSEGDKQERKRMRKKRKRKRGREEGVNK